MRPIALHPTDAALSGGLWPVAIREYRTSGRALERGLSPKSYSGLLSSVGQKTSLLEHRSLLPREREFSFRQEKTSLKKMSDKNEGTNLQLNCTLSAGLWAILQEHSRKTNEPVSHIVSRALAEYFQVSHSTLYQVSTATALIEGIYQGAVRIAGTRGPRIRHIRESGRRDGDRRWAFLPSAQRWFSKRSRR